MRLHLPQQELEITSRKARASIWCCRWKLARILPEIILQKRRLQPLCPADFFVVSGRPSPSVHREKVAHITSMSTGARVYLWHVPCSQTSHNHRKKASSAASIAWVMSFLLTRTFLKHYSKHLHAATQYFHWTTVAFWLLPSFSGKTAFVALQSERLTKLKGRGKAGKQSSDFSKCTTTPFGKITESKPLTAEVRGKESIFQWRDLLRPVFSLTAAVHKIDISCKLPLIKSLDLLQECTEGHFICSAFTTVVYRIFYFHTPASVARCLSGQCFTSLEFVSWYLQWHYYCHFLTTLPE